ncbi:MAG: HEAT repeat domain-containing protein [Bacteroidota bacterium]
MAEDKQKLIVDPLADPDPDVRRSAAEALISGGKPDVVDSLASALKDEDKGVRDAAFRSLVAIGGFPVASAIVGYIGSKNIVTRNLAANLLVQLGESAIAAILPYLSDEDQDIRKFAVDILGSIGHAVPASAVIPLLNDADANVVVSAVEALGNIKATGALDDLYRAYLEHGYAKAAVAEALGKIGDRDACDFLLLRLQEVLESPAQDTVTVFAIVEALSGVGDEKAAGVLANNVSKVKGRLRSAFLHTLVQISLRAGKGLECPPDRIPDFLNALKDADPVIRLSAAKALSHCRQSTVTYALIDALGNSPDLDGFLMTILPNRTDTFQTAIRYVEDHRAESVKHVILLIGKMVPDMSRTIMLNKLDESLERLVNRVFILVADRWATADEETRSAIVDVLFRLDGDNAVEFLDAIMNDPDPWLRMHVIEIIAAISDPRAPDFITRFLEDEDAMVREVAVGILQSRGYAVDAPEV